jgi:hypothetical protein
MKPPHFACFFFDASEWLAIAADGWVAKKKPAGILRVLRLWRQ